MTWLGRTKRFGGYLIEDGEDQDKHLWSRESFLDSQPMNTLIPIQFLIGWSQSKLHTSRLYRQS